MVGTARREHAGDTDRMEDDVSLALLAGPDITWHQVVATDLQVAAPVAPGGDTVPRRPPSSARPDGRSTDIVEEWGLQSFPASDPPANW
jgi:hypothetical protein